MENSESHNALGPFQWGARKGKTCIELLIMKQLNYELSHLTRTTLVTFDNNAKSCYDRIVMNNALLRSQQLGMPKHATTLFGTILEEARYYIKTALGRTTEAYHSEQTTTYMDPDKAAEMHLHYGQ